MVSFSETERFSGKKLRFLLIITGLFCSDLNGQDFDSRYKAYIIPQTVKSISSDYDAYIVSNQHVSRRSRVTHTYLNQTFRGIRIFNSVMSIHLTSEGRLLTLHDQFSQDIQSKISVFVPSITREEMVMKVADYLKIEITDSLIITEKVIGADEKMILTNKDISTEPIPVGLIYFPVDSSYIALSWEMYIHEKQGAKWWHIIADATTGELHYQENLYITCDFGVPHMHDLTCFEHSGVILPDRMENKRLELEGQSSLTQTNVYNVFPLGVESPSHGGRAMMVNPANPVASPFGWHDTNGAPGAEHTTTKGNNVEAREDIDGSNTTLGNMAQGGSDLIFDFPLSFDLPPAQSQNAAITNLFYWNNIMHDVWYQYGFDEPAGNFQQNNYGNGGLANDFVRADALDGLDVNNANFATPVDGSNPRMQMFLWNGSASSNIFTVTAPQSVAGNYTSVKAGFGAQDFDISGQVIIADDGSANPTLACNSLVNSAQIAGKIALIDRGSCEFGLKCLNAQNAGAIAVIMCNNVSGDPISMAPGAVGDQVTIPCVMISQANCNALRVTIPNLLVSMIGSGDIQIDGDYDNGVIAHEYGHGISIRLTGGAGNSSCLGNQEQMGEGWSDWFGLMLTFKPDHTSLTPRGIGTYVINQPPTGGGIRSFPYTTNMSVNPHTYDAIKNENVSVPHGVGSVWCAMLWEMTWNLIKEYGYDPDVYYGTGGNNMAMALVTEALKLQPCSPGFVSGRDAILLADQVHYGGRNQCLIWEAFAKRGLGFSAVQGSTNNRSDGTQAFDMPASCCTYVMNTMDSGDRSVRQAITCAVPGDTIRFSPNIQDQIISIISGSLAVNKNLTFEATNPNRIIIGTSETHPVFEIAADNEVTMNKIKIHAGNAESGRAIINDGILTLKDVSVLETHNTSGGSTILNNGTLNISGKTQIQQQ
jgi:extracellular elastinolytic metalloproteinase